MNVSDKLEEAKIKMIEEAKSSQKFSKFLSLIKNEIDKLVNENISISEQVKIVNSAFETEINISTYKGWYYRNYKKKSASKSVKKVAQKESNEAATLDNFDTYQRPKKTSKYDKFL